MFLNIFVITHLEWSWSLVYLKYINLLNNQVAYFKAKVY